jgi:hypothetical protein
MQGTMAAHRRVVEVSVSSDGLTRLESIAWSRTEPAIRLERARMLLASRANLSWTAFGRPGRGDPPHRLRTLVLVLRFGLAVTLAAPPTAMAAMDIPAYPLQVSTDHRHLVDRDGVPFLMVGDSPHSLIGRMSRADAELYMANRERYGINTLWVELLCNDATACNAAGTTYDGIRPFLVPGDIATPNPDYFRRVDDMLALAVAHRITLLLDVVETDGWLPIYRSNGLDKAFAFGRYLGQRYKDVPNIVWMYGNDFQTWRNPDDDRLVQAVARGIRSADAVHLNTTELNYFTSASRDDLSWEDLIQLDGIFTYYPMYNETLKEYNRTNPMPVFVEEASYEFEHIRGTGGGSPANLRRQEYWTMLSGATGQVYGSRYTWRLPPGWLSRLDSPGAAQLALMRGLFASRRWYDLVPDQDHTVLVDGFGVPATLGTGSVTTDTYATAARTADGTLVVAYMPTLRTMTVDMAKLAGPAAARWYDPTNGTYTAAGSPLPSAGRYRFGPPGHNHDGDGDWVLLLETAGVSSGGP